MKQNGCSLRRSVKTQSAHVLCWKRHFGNGKKNNRGKLDWLSVALSNYCNKSVVWDGKI